MRQGDEEVVNVVEVESAKLVVGGERSNALKQRYWLLFGFIVTFLAAGGIGSAITFAVLRSKTTERVTQGDPKGRKPDGTPTDNPSNIYESLGRTCENGYTMNVATDRPLVL